MLCWLILLDYPKIDKFKNINTSLQTVPIWVIEMEKNDMRGKETCFSEVIQLFCEIDSMSFFRMFF